MRRINPITSSIRRQLLVWLLVPLSVLWAIFGALTYVLAIELAEYGYDRALGDSVRFVASRLRFSGTAVELDLPAAAEALLRDDPKDKFYFQVLTADGVVLSGDRDMPPPHKTRFVRGPEYWDAVIDGTPVRMSTMKEQIPGANGGFVYIQVAETLKEREQLERRILITIAIPEILTVLLAAGAIWLGVSRGLAPLRSVTDAVSRRSKSDLHPIKEDDAPKEVRPLVHAVNDLLKRIEDDMETQRRFVANAAHQLRTPLAGLKTQTQLALRQSRSDAISPALHKIHTSADRCARLVQQLLALARAEPGVIEREKYSSVDLTAVARNATEELVPEAVAKGIDLGFEGAGGCMLISGESVSLHELAFNVIENAVRYTPAGGSVTVSIAGGADTVSLSVLDNGPGIPPEERERVLERFYRVLGTRESGSGLGLAIVKEIARAHRATVTLGTGANGGGTRVTVTFPARTEESLHDLAPTGSNADGV